MPQHIPSSRSRSSDQSRGSNPSHQPGAAEVLTRSNTGEVSHAVAYLDVLEMTRLIVEDQNIAGGIGRVNPNSSLADIAECIQQLTRRLVAEMDRTHQEGADAQQMWESILLLGRATLESIPLGFARRILQYCWTELQNLRGQNHTFRRCSCFSKVLDSETPRCRWTHQADRHFDPDGGMDEDLPEPSYMDANYIREETIAIVAFGQPYARLRPVHESVTAKEIWDCAVPALQRAIVGIRRVANGVYYYLASHS